MQISVSIMDSSNFLRKTISTTPSYKIATIAVGLLFVPNGDVPSYGMRNRGGRLTSGSNCISKQLILSKCKHVESANERFIKHLIRSKTHQAVTERTFSVLASNEPRVAVSDELCRKSPRLLAILKLSYKCLSPILSWPTQ